MALRNYRHYRIESSGVILVAGSLHAANDEDAITRVNRRHPDGTCEIWEARRLVTRLSRHRFDPDDQHVQDAVAARLTKLLSRIRSGLQRGSI